MRWFHETVSRSLVKTISFRLLVAAIDFIIIYAFTHRIDLTLGFVAITTILRTILYFFHERLWDRIRWGRSPRKGRW